jgi:hypothetical protein
MAKELLETLGSFRSRLLVRVAEKFMHGFARLTLRVAGLGVRIAVCELELVAEVHPGSIRDPFRRWDQAFIVCVLVIEAAIETAVKVSRAPVTEILHGRLLLVAHPLFITPVARLHRDLSTSIKPISTPDPD